MPSAVDPKRIWAAAGKFAALILFAGLSAHATNFSFYATLRAGVPGNGDWEIGVGSTPSASTAVAQMAQPVGQNTWLDSAPQTFRIGYIASTNTAYGTVWNSVGTAITASFNPAGGGSYPASHWELPASSMSVSAAARPATTGVTVSGLTFNSGASIISPFSSTTLAAVQTANAGATDSQASTIVFKPATDGGDWYLTGQITFTGLNSYVGSTGASRSQLQFNLLANSVDNPEPATFVLLGCGLMAIAWFGRRSQTGPKD